MQYQRHEWLFWHIYQWTYYLKENNKLKHRLVDTTPSEAQRNKKSEKQNILRTEEQYHMVNILEFQKE